MAEPANQSGVGAVDGANGSVPEKAAEADGRDRPAWAPPWLERYALMVLFAALAAVFTVGLFNSDKTAACGTLTVIAVGGVVVMALSPKLSKFSIGLKGVSGELRDVKETVKEVTDRLSELERMQQERAYDMNHDLLRQRSNAYQRLWEEMHFSAVYTAKPFSPAVVQEYTTKLSDWYFSPAGGLYLTKRAREFYFPLQHLLSDIDELPSKSWNDADRSRDSKREFEGLLKKLADELKDQKHPEALKGCMNEGDRMNLIGEEELTRVIKAMENDKTPGHEDWKKACRLVSAKLKSLIQNKDPGAGKTIFCAVQQVSSVLRTVLTQELGSRENVYLPRVEPVKPQTPRPRTTPPNALPAFESQ
jgi:hypothetical protein